MIVVLKILNSCITEITPNGYKVLKEKLAFEDVFYKPTPYGPKKAVQYYKTMVSKSKSGYFIPTGLLMHAVAILESEKIKYEIIGEQEKLPVKKPKLKGITFRDDQERMIDSALQKQRGVLIAPTGTGKSILALGIMSALPKKAKILFLAHTVDLVKQFKADCEKYGFDTGLVQGQSKDISKRVTCATIQTISKLDWREISDHWDTVLIDESHKVSSVKNRYSDFLQRQLAPMKIGFTATIPKEGEARWCSDAFIGPPIDEVTMDEGVENEMLTPPIVKILTYQRVHGDPNIRQYKDYYNTFIVNNPTRNRLIVKAAKHHIDKGQSVLIFVSKISQGDILQQLAKDKGLTVPFYRGQSPSDEREDALKRMKSKDILACICTTIWKEGINIPPLNVIINASGGKSDIQTIQVIGRGTRKFEDKDKLIVYDFVDPYRYIADHFCLRLLMYKNLKWEVKF